jgi:hypothetical protein
MWDTFYQGGDKVFNIERILLSASDEYLNDIRNKLSGKIPTIESLSFTEFKQPEESFMSLVEKS